MERAFETPLKAFDNLLMQFEENEWNECTGTVLLMGGSGLDDIVGKSLLLLATEQHHTGRYDNAAEASRIIERWTTNYMYVVRAECLAELQTLRPRFEAM